MPLHVPLRTVAVSISAVGLVLGPVAVSVADATPALGPCAVDVNGLTYTLTQDCTTSATITLPDGATLDGAGYTITAVEDATTPNFSGAVIKSATGDDSAPASLNVQDLNIDAEFSGSNSGGVLNGIEMLRAGGSIEGVTVNGITHGNGVQEGNGIAIRNRVSGDNIDVPRAQVTLDDVVVTNYQKSGVLLDGNLRFTATGLNIGQAGTMAGDPMPSHVIGSNGLQISRGASGSVTDSTFSNNTYDGQTSTAVLLYNARHVTFTRNVISGPNADLGLAALNVSNTLDTTLEATCNLIENTASTPASTSMGLDVDVADSKPSSLSWVLADNTVRGWGAASVPATQDTGTGACTAPAPVVDATAVRRSVTVSWQQDDVPAYAPAIDGYTVTLVAPGASVVTRDLGPGADSTSFSHLVSGVDYTASVTTHNLSGDSADSVVVGGTKTVLTKPFPPVARGPVTHARGTVTTVDGQPVAGGTVYLKAHTAGSTGWTLVATTTTDATGAFTVTDQPSSRTTYRAVYAGNPYLGSRTVGWHVKVTH